MDGFERYLIDNGYSVFHVEITPKIRYVDGWKYLSTMSNLDNRYIKDKSKVIDGKISDDDYLNHMIVYGISHGIPPNLEYPDLPEAKTAIANLDFKKALTLVEECR